MSRKTILALIAIVGVTLGSAAGALAFGGDGNRGGGHGGFHGRGYGSANPARDGNSQQEGD
jgi:hypothetical protein